MRPIALVMLVVAAVALAQTARPDGGSTRQKPAPDAGLTPDACHPTDEQLAACLAKGPTFTWGPTPEIWCSGIPPSSTAPHRAVTCSCFDQAQVERRRLECSTVPSAPPGGGARPR
jgi:hypothetical protein